MKQEQVETDEPMKMRHKGRKWWLLILLTLGGIGLFWWMLPRDQNLLHKATRIMPVVEAFDSDFFSTSGQRQKTLFNLPYAWETDRSLLLVRFGEDNGSSGNWGMWHVYRVGIGEGKPIAADKINRALNPAMSSIGFVPTEDASPEQQPHILSSKAFLTSPDGRWSLWFNPTGGGGTGAENVAVRMDGSEIRRWPLPYIVESRRQHGMPVLDYESQGIPFWLPDGRHWGQIAEMTSRTKTRSPFLRICDTVDEHSSQTYPIDLLPENLVLGVMANGQALMAQYYRLNARQSVYSVGTPASSKPPNIMHCIAFACGPQTMPPRAYDITAPGGSEVEEVRELSLSSKGDRLAWLVKINHKPHANAFVRLIRAFFPDRAGEKYVIWTTDVEGNDPQSVGSMDAKPQDAAPTDLHWVPGGKRLSFRYKDDLYTVPAQ